MSMNFLFLFFSSDKPVCARVLLYLFASRLSSLSISFYYFLLTFIILSCIFSPIFFILFGPLFYVHPKIHYKEPGAPRLLP
jgi:hypothetical protein